MEAPAGSSDQTDTGDRVVDVSPPPGNVSVPSADEALELLGTRRVGRLAYVDETGDVVVLPVNYALDGTTIVFQSASKATLRRAQERARVTFEVDDFSEASRTGWSVVVRGPLETTRAQDIAPTVWPDTWRSAPDLRLVRITIDQVTARRIEAHSGAGALWIG